MTNKAFTKTLPPALAALAPAIIAQSGGWESFTRSAHNVTNHGAAVGFSGWIYYTETEGFFARNRKKIIALVKELAEDIGEEPFAMVAGFNCFRGDPPTFEEIGQTLFSARRADHSTCISNALAWFALEELCHAYVNATEEA